MPNKKDTAGNGELTPEEQQKLEAKVDKMMDPHASDKPAKGDAVKPAADTPAKDGDLPPIDIFSDPKTAPDVPDEVLKTMVEPKVDHKMAESDAKVINPDQATKATLPDDTTDPLDDDKLNQAVEDITKHEGDEVLAAEDAEVGKAFEPDQPKHKGKLRRFFGAWLGSKKGRRSTGIGIIVLLLVVAAVPFTRAFALNIFGVRATAQLTVLDNTTDLPLSDVRVRLGGMTASTDVAGKVTLRHVKLGSQTLSVQKAAFATYNHKVNVNVGSNTFMNVSLVAVGAQYKFKLTDYASGQPITAAMATSKQASAIADSKGLVVLTVPDPNTATIPVTITAADHAPAHLNLRTSTTATTAVQMVSDRKEVYISKQSGKYDVYKADIDGHNKQLLLAGTGNENSQLTLIADPTGQEAALVSTRDDLRDSGGYLMQTLTLIDISSGVTTTIDHSDRIDLVDWIGSRLVYTAAKAGASAADPSRYLLKSYDYLSNQRLQLDHANYFNDIVSANGSVYYATSNVYGGGISQFVRINPDGTNRQVLLTNDVWNIFRTSYDKFALSTPAGWYTYSLGDAKPIATHDAYSGTSRLYLDSPDGKHAVWIDKRDGKGALVVYDKSTQQETTLVEQSGLTYPVRWLDNNTLIYRISDSQETADYVIGLTGSSAGKKITDVTDASGLELWYYY